MEKKMNRHSHFSRSVNNSKAAGLGPSTSESASKVTQASVFKCLRAKQLLRPTNVQSENESPPSLQKPSPVSLCFRYLPLWS